MVEERDRRVSKIYDLAREAGLEAGEHPAPERLFEYQEGFLTEEEDAEVQDHLALCPECARMVLELSGAVEPEAPEPGEPLSDRRIREVWPATDPRLPLPPRPQAPPRRRWLERVALPLAATLLVATLATSFWAWSLRQRNRQLREPNGNVAILDLVPLSEEGIHRNREEQAAGVSREAEAVLLVLNLSDLRPFPVYRAEIQDALDGKVLWAAKELQRSSSGNFTLQFSRPFPGSGRYRIRLVGLNGSRRERLAEYEVDLGKAE